MHKNEHLHFFILMGPSTSFLYDLFYFRKHYGQGYFSNNELQLEIEDTIIPTKHTYQKYIYRLLVLKRRNKSILTM